MKNRLEVQLTPRLALFEIVDQDRCPDPCRSNFSNQSLQRHELTTTVDQIVYGEYPIPGLDEALGQSQLEVAVFVIGRASDRDPRIAVEGLGSVLTDWAKTDAQARCSEDTCEVSAGGGADDNGGSGRAEGFSEQVPTPATTSGSRHQVYRLKNLLSVSGLVSSQISLPCVGGGPWGWRQA